MSVISKKQVGVLLDKLCVELGFCLPSEDAVRLQQDPPPNVRAFVDAVFAVEGLEPSTADRRLHRQVRDMVAEVYRSLE
jgi:hypothetical protein